MKKYFMMLLAIAFSLNIAMADDETAKAEDPKDQINTIFGSDIKSTGYIAISPKATMMNDELGLMMGGRAAWTINKVFSIGFAGNGLVSRHNVDYKITPDTTGYNSNINLGYGGLFLEYIYNPKEFIHLSANTIIGFGGVMYGNMMDSLHNLDYDYNYRDRNNDPNTALFVIEPGLALEFNFTRHFRVTLEASYRYMTSFYENTKYQNATNLKDVNLSGFSGGLTFQFGCF